MVPYVEQPAWDIGPLTIHLFGLLVAAAVLSGYQIAIRRAERFGLDPLDGERIAFTAIVVGLIGAHLYSVLAYFPEQVAENPLLLLKIWDGISSFGGIIGGLLGIWFVFRFRLRSLSAARKWAHIDALAFAFTFAWFFGRLGCTFAHDHPGHITDFFLGISLESEEAREFIRRAYFNAGRLAELPPAHELRKLAFHDLGWYEWLYTTIVMIPAMLFLDRKPRRPGTFVAAFFIIYSPVRFAMDFLRIADERYLGLTPGHWAAFGVLGAGIALLFYNRRFDPIGKRTRPPAGESESAKKLKEKRN